MMVFCVSLWLIVAAPLSLEAPVRVPSQPPRARERRLSCYLSAFMNGPPRWNFFDTAYALVGVFFAAMLYGRFGEDAWLPGSCWCSPTAAGRAAGSHH